MVWQLVVLFGAHTFTDTNSVLTLGACSPAGPPSTMTFATLLPVGKGLGGLGPRPPPPPPPPPPQAESASAIRPAMLNFKARRIRKLCFAPLTVFLPRSCRRGWRPVNR